jgi:hypothetical protein
MMKLNLDNMNNKKPIPEVGGTYYFFDDGKISEMRRGKVHIYNVIPFNEINKDISELWKQEVKDSSWGLYEKETDYFVFGTIIEQDKKLVFARSKGGWFSFTDSLWDGRLDVDGELNKLLEKLN